MSRSEINTSFLTTIVFSASLGGFLFGYDTSIIAGALQYISLEFHLDIFMKGMIVSILIIGALFGAAISGWMADRFGRRLTIMISSIFFVLGGIVLVMSDLYISLLIGRVIVGIGVGVSSVVIPLYIAELSPAKHRGRLVTINQLAITVGILVAYLINLYYADTENWRVMFGYSIIPALIQFLAMLYLPESPSWLLRKDQPQKAFITLQFIQGTETAKNLIAEMSKSLTEQKRSRFRDLFAYYLLPALWIGIGLSVFQQLTGINTLIYYAHTILKHTGFEAGHPRLWATVGIGIINVIATLFAVWLLDKAGRRKLLLIGLIGMFIGLVSLACFTLFQSRYLNTISMLSLLLYVVSFAIGLGPVTWLIISEIFPLHVRGVGMSVAIVMNWLANYLVAFSFLPMINSFGMGGTFLVFAGVTLLALLFSYFKVPETKGKTLEEISSLIIHK